jgi:hypothetical protein
MQDRRTISAHLEEAERHARQGAIHVANQRNLIADLERGGHDTTDARALLRQFEDLQELHVADRDRLRQELKALS